VNAATTLSGMLGAWPLPYPYDLKSTQYALVAGLAIGIAAPLLGAFLVERRMSLMGDGIGHLAFAGVSIGLATDQAPLAVALVVSVLGAVLLEWLRSTGRAAGDLALAVLLYSGLAGGIVIASLSGSYDASVLSYLFGSLLSIQTNEVWLVLVISALIVSIVAWQWRRLLAVVTDGDFARTIGISVRVVDLAIAVGTALVIVAAMRAVGLLLVSSMMVLPVGAARPLSKSFGKHLVLSAVIGGASVLVGLTGSSIQGDLPPGATIVLVGVLAVGMSALFDAVRR
jgi:zinc transport system permease protein